MSFPFPRTLAPTTQKQRLGVPAAAPGEWAVAGAFRYHHRDPATLVGREAPVFKASWYGLSSFAPALLVEVAEIAPGALDRVLRLLAAHLLESWKAPDATTAVETAREEIEFALAQCGAHPRGTVLALRREFNEQGMIERAVAIADPPRC